MIAIGYVRRPPNWPMVCSAGLAYDPALPRRGSSGAGPRRRPTGGRNVGARARHFEPYRLNAQRSRALSPAPPEPSRELGVVHVRVDDCGAYVRVPERRLDLAQVEALT